MAFQKFLCISAQTSRLQRDDFLLVRCSWKDIAGIKNLADYDHIYLNLTALFELQTRHLTASAIDTIFSAESWAFVLAAGGSIVLVGDPMCSLIVETPGSDFDVTAPLKISPLEAILHLQKDDRELDYRRVRRNDRTSFETIYKYLDAVAAWRYSLADASISKVLTSFLDKRHVQKRKTQTIGQTSFSTCLATQFEFLHIPTMRIVGDLTILPPSQMGTDAEDLFVIRDWFGIQTAPDEPKWVTRLKIPGEFEIANGIAERRATLSKVQDEIGQEEVRLRACKRWYRLLYDDGDSLEMIVQESLRLLGARVDKLSKEKDDFRVSVGGLEEAVMEVKGTHNQKFTKGALRQLAGWMDEVNANEGKIVKGIFVGNAARNTEPAARPKLLFEDNCVEYARIKDIVIIRTVDLFCLTILQQLTRFNSGQFWNDFHACRGAFDAKTYWELLPEEFRPSSTPALE